MYNSTKYAICQVRASAGHRQLKPSHCSAMLVPLVNQPHSH
ncbi:hypothetical protein [Kamptonema formosum]|nr:hypothetical protein [Oscillatoria sp. PCC 10802]